MLSVWRICARDLSEPFLRAQSVKGCRGMMCASMRGSAASSPCCSDCHGVWALEGASKGLSAAARLRRRNRENILNLRERNVSVEKKIVACVNYKTGLCHPAESLGGCGFQGIGSFALAATIFLTSAATA